MFKFLIFFYFSFISFFALAQLDNQKLTEWQNMTQDSTQKLELHLKNFNFLRNNEYFNDLVSGETFFGYQVSPSLVYFPHKNIRIEAGLFAWKDFGTEDYTEIKPIFSVKIKKDSLAVILGNLEGNYAHRLIEPLYAFERGINNRLENGLQFKWHKHRFYADAWVDWQQTVNKEKTRPELIWAGLVSHYNFIQKEKFTLQLPLQATIFHIGGQDLAIDTVLTNAVNLAIGLNFEFRFNENSFLKSIRSENYFVINRNTTADELIEDGQSLYFNLNLATKWADFQFNYWKGDGFNSFQGGDLYKSYPTKKDGIFQQKRDLVFLRILKNIEILPDLNLNVRFEPYMDLQTNLIEFSMGLYVVYQPKFLLWRKRLKY